MGRGQGTFVQASAEQLLFGRRSPRDDSICSPAPGPRAEQKFRQLTARLTTGDISELDKACQLLSNHRQQIARAPLLQALIVRLAAERLQECRIEPAMNRHERTLIINEWAQLLQAQLDKEPLDLEVLQRLDLDETHSWLSADSLGPWSQARLARYCEHLGSEHIRAQALLTIAQTQPSPAREQLAEAVLDEYLTQSSRLHQERQYLPRDRARSLAQALGIARAVEPLVKQTSQSYQGGPLHLVSLANPYQTVCGRKIPRPGQYHSRPWRSAIRGEFAAAVKKTPGVKLCCQNCAKHAVGHPAAEESYDWSVVDPMVDQQARQAAREVMFTQLAALTEPADLDNQNRDRVRQLLKEQFWHDAAPEVLQAAYNVYDQALIDQFLAQDEKTQRDAWSVVLPYRVGQVVTERRPPLPDREEWLQAIQANQNSGLLSFWFTRTLGENLAQSLWQRCGWDQAELDARA